jgi:hypothetical protein
MGALRMIYLQNPKPSRQLFLVLRLQKSLVPQSFKVIFLSPS